MNYKDTTNTSKVAVVPVKVKKKDNNSVVTPGCQNIQKVLEEMIFRFLVVEVLLGCSGGKTCPHCKLSYGQPCSR